MSGATSSVGRPKEEAEVNLFQSVVQHFQTEIPEAPNGSLGRNLLGEDGIATRMFLICLSCNTERGIKFLQEVRLLKKQMKCPKCQGSMNLSKYEVGMDKFRRYCGKKGTEGRCQTSRSVRHSSWFTNSKLTFLEVMLLTMSSTKYQRYP
jgi:hypothetical protein